MNTLSPFVFFIALLSAIQGYGQDTLSIRKHLEFICASPARNYRNLDRLNEVASYIQDQFKAAGARVEVQEFQVQGNTYKNIIGSFGPEDGKRIVVGAHYDVAHNQPGADDNASGTVGLIELATRLGQSDPKSRIDLVAYTLEEPPFFRTEQMGSAVHAQSMKNQGIELEGMLSLEMIGYFSDEKGSQEFPLGVMRLFYGSRGDFIATVRKLGEGRFSRRFHRKFKRANSFSVKTLKGPRAVPGMDFSDHLYYWEGGYSALMITDTAFYRNKNYHEETDTISTLDLEKMTAVIEAVYAVLVNWEVR